MKGGKQLDHMVLGCARCDLDLKNLLFISAYHFSASIVEALWHVKKSDKTLHILSNQSGTLFERL